MIDIEPGIHVRVVGTMPVLPPALEAVVARHWDVARSRQTLFNGRIFSADHVAPDVIIGHWSEYRRVVAQFMDPGLQAALQADNLAVRNLAVCGVVVCDDGTVAVGRRDTGSVYQAGLWQLPPAGSIDGRSARTGGVDLAHALLTELWEELGLDATTVASLRPLCVVRHPTGVLDLGFQITTRLSAAQVLAAHREHGNEEYDRLLVLPPADLTAHVAALGGQLVPAARAFLRRLRPV